MDINLDGLNLNELKSLEKRVAVTILNFEQKKRDEALTAAKQIAQEHGFKLEDLMSNSVKIPKTKAEPKYQHPENEEFTWTGRGRKPNWFIEFIESGGSPDSILIK
jgi:DNA-binding protein H-NS